MIEDELIKIVTKGQHDSSDISLTGNKIHWFKYRKKMYWVEYGEVEE